MITKKIEFSGVEYPCRIGNEGFASEEASDIYDEIFFFTDEHALALPDKELVEELRRDNPEWF